MTERRQVDALEGAGGVSGGSVLGKWGGGMDGYKEQVAKLTEQRLLENANAQGTGVSNTGVSQAGNSNFSGNDDGASNRNNSQKSDAFVVSKADEQPAEVTPKTMKAPDVNPDDIRAQQEWRSSQLAQNDGILRSLRRPT